MCQRFILVVLLYHYFVESFIEAASEKAGQLYTLKASIQQETPTKPALPGKAKVVCCN